MKKSADSCKSVATPEYSSPPCYAHEFPGYFGQTGDVGREQPAAKANALPEAERAGAEVLPDSLPPVLS